MKSLFLLLAVTLTVSAAAMAGTPSGKSGSVSQNVHVTVNTQSTFIQPTFKSFPNYHLTYGVKFSNGFYYKGFDHYHWSKVYFSNFYGCQIYYCPYTLVEYYWCEWDCRYYPVTYKPYGRFVF